MTYYSKTSINEESELPLITTLSGRAKAVSATGKRPDMSNILYFSTSISLPPQVR